MNPKFIFDEKVLNKIKLTLNPIGIINYFKILEYKDFIICINTMNVVKLK